MSRMITGIQEKVLLLSHRAQRASSSTTIGQSLHDLDHTLNQVLVEYPLEHPVIPSAKSKITPNQHSWPETAAVMGACPKGKHKQIHTDAYTGGERNGTKAKPDAQVAPSSGSNIPAQSTTPQTNLLATIPKNCAHPCSPYTVSAP
ncbi:hypothetical protein FIBSPDRAFT_966390 [Athelia psychrophila]|uniref:Uncharacterized protein n=1 Tax=Athelia psychrophila TaxID=1759441 RepID=A0A167WUZ4_9AGAM|nr:hypothetical protein FIBSPDRAFT_966390 [Fibularhizoctonia sp. CBS 109695]